MPTLDAELLLMVLAIVPLLLIPLTTKMIGLVGDDLSAELDEGRTGSDLTRYLSRKNLATGGSEAAEREREIRQLIEARAFVRSRRGATPIDVEAEVDRALHHDV
jgi:hypothetical protein